jgi:rod shape-determining protein MreC
LIFFAFVYFAISLIINNNQFQRSKYLIVAKEATGKFYAVTNGYQSYLKLRSDNTDLLNRIAELEDILAAFQEQLESQSDSTHVAQIQIDSVSTLIYHFQLARVVNNSIAKLENYITLDQGSEDGIEVDMGVMTSRGVIGVVTQTTPHFSTVISVLNPKFKLSGMLKHTNYFGPLVWNGENSRYTYLTELPRHAEFTVGDTIITSGYSNVFPKGLPIGTIMSNKNSKEDVHNSIKIKLFADMGNLNEVLVVKNGHQQERKALENNITQ